MSSCSSYKVFHSVDMQSNKLQNILNKAVNEYKLPGLQAGIVFPDGKKIVASSGTVDFERKDSLITNQSIFRIGSTTKLFVAVLIGRLIEKGLLSYDDKIDKWFPNIPSANSISIQELLNQNSGIEENLFTKPSFLVKSMLSDNKVWNTQDVVNKIMKGMPIVPKEQRHFVYANNNYLLLGLIAEKVVNKKLSVQLEEEFFIPMKMKNTFFIPYHNSLPDNLICGYDEYIPMGPHKIKPTNMSWSSLVYSAGSMVSTSEDLLIWFDALFHKKILEEKTLEKFRTYINAKDNGRDNNIIGYGLGIAQYELNGNILEGHPGGGFGGECFPFYFKDKDVSIVVVYNWSKKDNPAGKAVLN